MTRKDLVFDNCAWRGFRLVCRNPDIEIGWHISLRAIEIKEYYANGSRATRTYVKSFEEVLKHFSSYNHNLTAHEKDINNKICEEALKLL